MKPEDKQLLLADLCARLPYGVKGSVENHTGTFVVKTVFNKGEYIDGYFKEFNISRGYHIEEFKPYLRPLSSMTDEEFEYLNKLGVENSLKCIEIDDPKESFSLATKFCVEQLAYLYKRHYDVFGLIPDGLAKSTETFNPYDED